MTRRRVLAIAEAANPDWVSVPLVGWSLAHALREVADVHLVTHARNRAAILDAGYVEGREVTFIDSDRLARPLWQLGEALRMGQGKGWTTIQALNALAYPHFERLVWRAFGAEIKAGAYDIVHRITPLSPTIASPVAARCARAGVPFVLGPLNGGVPWPEGFNSERLRERELLSYLRSAYRYLPGRARTLRHAAAILTGSRHTQSEIPARYQDKVIYLPENAVDPAKFSRLSRPGPKPLRACFIGRMVPYKGPDMLLAAAAPLLQSGAMTLEMIGDGPMMNELRAQVAEEGTDAAVTFHGWLPHGEVESVAGRCHMLTFPSIREFGGGVVLEAMALGLTDAAFGTIWDPMAVRLCHAAGEGARLALRFGGKTSSVAGDPVDAEVLVKRVQKDAVQSFGTSVVPLGDCAVIEVQGIEVVLNSNRAQAFSPDLFSNLGIDTAARKILVVKSTNHFHGAFAPIAAEILYAAVDGPYPNDPRKNAYTRLTRPLWPIVDNPHELEAQ